MALAFVAGQSSSSTTNAASYALTALTPAIGDLLVVAIIAGATTATPGLTDNRGGTYYLASSNDVNGDLHCIFVRNEPVDSAISHTLTFTCTGNNADGCAAYIARFSGSTRFGADAVRAAATPEEGAGGTTPNCDFASAPLTGNAIFATMANAANPATVTPPTSFTEQYDGGYSAPTTGLEVATRDSGHTATQVLWASTSASAWGALAVELIGTSALTASHPSPGYVVTNTDGTSFQTAACSVVAGDLLLAFVAAKGTVAAAPTVTDTQGGTWVLIRQALYTSSADSLYLFARLTAPTTSGTFQATFDCTGDAAAAVVGALMRIPSSPRFGAYAIRQTAADENQAAGDKPAPAFAVAALVDNLILAASGWGHTASSATTARLPFTEDTDRGTSDGCHLHISHRNDGHTATGVTYTDDVLATYGSAQMVVEVDASAGTVNEASLSGSFAFTGSANAEPLSTPVDASISGGFAFTGSASAGPVVDSSASGAFAFAGSASAEPIVDASASGGFAFAGSASAEPIVDASVATGAFAFTGSATVSVVLDARVGGTAAAPQDFTARYSVNDAGGYTGSPSLTAIIDLVGTLDFDDPNGAAPQRVLWAPTGRYMAEFDGATTYIDTTNAASAALAASWSYVAEIVCDAQPIWNESSGNPDIDCAVFRTPGYGGEFGLFVRWNTVTEIIEVGCGGFRIGGDGYGVVWVDGPAIGERCFVTGSFDAVGNIVSVRLNKGTAGTANWDLSGNQPPINPVRMGIGTVAGTGWFEGKVGEVRFFDRTIDDAESDATQDEIDGSGGGAAAYTSYAGSANAAPLNDATLSGAFAFAGSASAEPVVDASVSGGFPFAGSAAVDVVNDAAISGTFPFAGSAEAEPLAGTIDASLSGTFPFAGSAVAEPIVDTSTSGTFPFAGSATAAPIVDSSLSGTFPFAGSMVAAPIVDTSASGGFPFAGSASVDVVNDAALSGTFPFGGSADVSVVNDASLSGTFPFGGSADVSVVNDASLSGTFPFAGSAAVDVVNDAALSGSFPFAGSASAGPIVDASLSGSFPFAGSAAASPLVDASLSGGFPFAGSADVEVVDDVIEGNGATAFAWSGSGAADVIVAASGAAAFGFTASGAADVLVAAAGSPSFSSVASGAADVIVGASGAVTFAGVASGAADALTGATGTTTFAWSGSGAADVIVAASGSPSIAGASALGAADVIIEAGGSGSFYGEAEGLSGDLTLASGAMAFGGWVSSAAADVIVDAAGGTTTFGFTAAGSAPVIVDATAALSFATEIASGAGDVVISASGAVSYAGTGAGTGEVDPLQDVEGNGAATFGFTSTGAADVIVEAGGATSFAGPIAATVGVASGEGTYSAWSVAAAADVLVDVAGTPSALGVDAVGRAVLLLLTPSGAPTSMTIERLGRLTSPMTSRRALRASIERSTIISSIEGD